MTPKERMAFLNKKFQNDLIRTKEKLKGDFFSLIGTKRKPRGIKIETDKKTLELLLKLPFVDSRLSSDNRPKRNDDYSGPSYFCSKVICGIQVEGQTKGLQTIEERFMIVKADNWKKAEEKIRKGFKDYEKPYLNGLGQFVRWKFYFIEETYYTTVDNKNDFDNPKGVEVFSKLRTKKLKKENIWSGD
jgi:hypothetical protein